MRSIRFTPRGSKKKAVGTTVDFGGFRWMSVDLNGFRWISGEIWDFVLGSLVPGWLEISLNSIENMENASTPDSGRERSVSSLRVCDTRDKP